MRVMFVAVVGLTVSGCITIAAPPTAAPPTPPPATATAAPATPTLAPTTAAANVYTVDDARIDTMIRDGSQRFLDYAQKLQDPTLNAVDTMVGMVSFANSQQVAVLIYRPSPCTAAALESYKQGLDITATSGQQFIDYYRDFKGSPPDDSGFSTGGNLIGSAVRLLNESGCSPS